ncbi:Digeranylgeranylglyceryl phosphate synthase [Mycena venus]|uniref:Digeranylgeranylglyceryl phosphate synthase n=1 Tax=Mycena venus TaxID=2733690 RepID=A0A8H6WYK9_9AGAR|nr:Digeranylgeranylglyceryl phosphate synthase [Mycena venus]
MILLQVEHVFAPARDALRAIIFTLHTAFLFTKSDIKTTVIPITFLAAASAPLVSLYHLPHVIFWIWVHVLQFDVSNQILQPAEDALNKKDRPLPSNRISPLQALIFRWLLVPLCGALSACYSVETVYASAALILLTILYNELAAHSGHWVVRNIVNAAGFASFEVGATLVAGSNPHFLDKIATLSIAISAGIFATTIHAQDFKDEKGEVQLRFRFSMLIQNRRSCYRPSNYSYHTAVVHREIHCHYSIDIVVVGSGVFYGISTLSLVLALFLWLFWSANDI